MSEWIDVEDRLPKEGDEVLFNVPMCYGVEKGRLYGGKWISDRTSPYNDQVDFDLDSVNCWMPLPEPPQNKGQTQVTVAE